MKHLPLYSESPVLDFSVSYSFCLRRVYLLCPSSFHRHCLCTQCPGVFLYPVHARTHAAHQLQGSFAVPGPPEGRWEADSADVTSEDGDLEKVFLILKKVGS